MIPSFHSIEPNCSGSNIVLSMILELMPATRAISPTRKANLGKAEWLVFEREDDLAGALMKLRVAPNEDEEESAAPVVPEAFRL